MKWYRGEAHHPCEFMFLTYIAIENLAPPTDLPWRNPRGFVARTWRRLVWLFFFPILALTWVMDHAIAALARRPGGSNAYRVVAKKV